MLISIRLVFLCLVNLCKVATQINKQTAALKAEAEPLAVASRGHEKDLMMPKRIPSTDSPLSQSLITTRVNFAAVCAEMNGWDITRHEWRFFFKEAECDIGDRRLIHITCRSRYSETTGYWYVGDDRKLMEMCRDNKVCQRVYFLGKEGEEPKEEIACVDDDAVKTEEVSAKCRASHPGQQDVHCGLSLEIPGPSYKQTPGVNMIDVVLTEEVLFPNGSAYPAPRLFIRDKSNRWGFDRVYRRDASVASAVIELNSVRGRLQRKTFQFCMQMMPSATGSSVIFMYSWFVVPHRRGGLLDHS